MLIFLLSLALIVTIGISWFVRQPQFGKLPAGDRLARIEQSPNYRNGAFHNQEPTPNFSNGGNFFNVFYEFIFKADKRNIPTDSIPHIKTDLHALPPDEDVLIWFGHSSYFIQLDGKRILVDPVFNGNASPVSFTTKSFAGTKVYTVDDMPPIDFLIITHDHWDHLDYKSVTGLKPKVSQVFCPLGVGAHLEYWGYEASILHESDWGDTAQLPGGFTLHTTPTRHFSGRGLKRNTSLWASYVLESPSKKIYIGGDSGMGPHFADIGKEHGPFDLVILENGQYNAYWESIHLMPNQILQAAEQLGTKNLMPVHAAKFPLANHAWDEPYLEITERNKSAGFRLLTPIIGEVVHLADTTQEFTDWWVGIK